MSQSDPAEVEGASDPAVGEGPMGSPANTSLEPSRKKDTSKSRKPPWMVDWPSHVVVYAAIAAAVGIGKCLIRLPSHRNSQAGLFIATFQSEFVGERCIMKSSMHDA